MEKWFIKNRVGNYKEISQKFGISELIAKLLVNRDIVDHVQINRFLNPQLDKLHDPSLMKDLNKSAKIVRDSIHNNEKIRIVGDYDVDGVISIYILFTEIKRLGGIVDYAIPNRIDDGYGINKDIIETAKKDGINMIITCDNGISAIDEIQYANELGIAVIITDHHEPTIVPDHMGGRKQQLPLAQGIINPKQLDCNYPFKKLCGAGVAFKLIQELHRLFGLALDQSYPLLEYIAIATVCDVVDLVDENRIIVKKGLELLNTTNNIGLRALIRETGMEGREIGVYHLGFVLGPNINASGRLDSAIKPLELLLSNDESKASNMAKELRSLNEERKEMTIEGVEKVFDIIEDTNIKKDKVLVVYEPEIHESIAGIIAGRIKDRYNKPTIVLTNGKEGIKGSGRSIEEYNMFEELSKCKDVLIRFGGHPMAAGLSLNHDNIEMLRNRLNSSTKLTDEDLVKKIYIDTHLPLDYISFKLLNQLEALEPFGKGNNKPIFGEKNLKVKKGDILGKNRNVLKLILENHNNIRIEGLFFGDIPAFEEGIRIEYGENEFAKLLQGIDNHIRVDILFYPSINEYNGNTTLQAIIRNYRFISIDK